MVIVIRVLVASVGLFQRTSGVSHDGMKSKNDRMKSKRRWKETKWVRLEFKIKKINQN